MGGGEGMGPDGERGSPDGEGEGEEMGLEGRGESPNSDGWDLGGKKEGRDGDANGWNGEGDGWNNEWGGWGIEGMSAGNPGGMGAPAWATE